MNVYTNTDAFVPGEVIVCRADWYGLAYPYDETVGFHFYGSSNGKKRTFLIVKRLKFGIEYVSYMTHRGELSMRRGNWSIDCLNKLCRTRVSL